LKKIGVLNHRSFERLKNDPVLFQLVRNNIAMNKLIASEDQTASHLLKTTGVLEDGRAVFIAQLSPNLEGRKIE